MLSRYNITFNGNHVVLVNTYHGLFIDWKMQMIQEVMLHWLKELKSLHQKDSFKFCWFI